MHKHFHRIIDTFAKFKADADAGPHDNNTSPASIKYHQAVLSRTKSSHGQDPGRAREARGGTNYAHHLPDGFSRFPPHTCARSRAPGAALPTALRSGARAVSGWRGTALAPEPRRQP